MDILDLQPLHSLPSSRALSRAVQAGFVTHREFFARNAQIYPDLIRIAPLTAAMWRLNSYPAADDLWIELIKLCGFIAHPLLCLRVRIHLPECDLDCTNHVVIFSCLLASQRVSKNSRRSGCDGELRRWHG